MVVVFVGSVVVVVVAVQLLMNPLQNSHHFHCQRHSYGQYHSGCSPHLLITTCKAHSPPATFFSSVSFAMSVVAIGSACIRCPVVDDDFLPSFSPSLLCPWNHYHLHPHLPLLRVLRHEPATISIEQFQCVRVTTAPCRPPRCWLLSVTSHSSHDQRIAMY